MNDTSIGPVVLDLPIINEKGLHARASAKFVETVERFEATATVETVSYTHLTLPTSDLV